MASARKLKIGFVLDTSLDQPDGVQQYIITMGEWLRKQKHDVHYLVGESKRTDLKNVQSLARNISVRFNGNRTTIPLPTSRKKLRKYLEQENFDVLHVQVPHSPFMPQRLILAASKDTAVIGTFHIAPYSRMVSLGNRALGIWLKPSLKRFDKIVSVSSAAAEFAQSTFDIKTEVLPNVIEYKRFKRAKPFPNTDSRPTILFLGRLVPRKGCEVLLESVKLLSERKDVKPFKVVICGKGPLMPKIESFIKKNKLEDTVTLAGFVTEEDKPRYYASADISVFPSQGGESFGIVLLEAMASGKSAVLAGDNPGYRTVMSPRSELLFDPYSAHALADLLTQYIGHPKVRQRAQDWGTAYASEFDVGVVGRKLETIYAQALRNRDQQ